MNNYPGEKNAWGRGGGVASCSFVSLKNVVLVPLGVQPQEVHSGGTNSHVLELVPLGSEKLPIP